MARARSGATLAACVVVALAAAPAGAGTQTLRRSVQNLAFAPLDLALAPVVAGHAVWRGLRREEDPLAARIAFAAPGLVWNSGVQALGSVVRGLAGVLELPPGVVLAFTDRDLSALFDPAENGAALVDVETRALHVRIGVDYVSPP